jgi:acyl-CoA synthetase (AMP-forming)/AMP-acid ligase II
MGPEEIEAVACAHPAVREVCVVAEPDAVLGDAPAALVELTGSHHGEGGAAQEEEKAALAEEIRVLVTTRLARYAYPRRVVFGTIPRNSTGKMDRAATARLISALRMGE